MQDLHACLNSVTQVTDSSPNYTIDCTSRFKPFTVLNNLKRKNRSQNESEQNIFISSIKNLHLSYN